MITKLYNICNVLIKSKIIFKKPDYKDVLVLDSTSFDAIENILQSLDWNIFETRNELINKIYITPGLIVKFFINLKKGLKIAYLVSLIDEIKPKAVLTFIDNSFLFSDIARNMSNKKIAFIAIQNASRIDIAEQDYFYKKGLLKNNYYKKIFLPHFFCLGENDINKYKKYKIKVKKFYKLELNSLSSKILSYWEKDFDSSISKHEYFLSQNFENQEKYCSKFSEILENMDVFTSENDENKEEDNEKKDQQENRSENNENETSPDENKNLSEELDKLNQLYQNGVLTKEEFEKAKNKLLNN